MKNTINNQNRSLETHTDNTTENINSNVENAFMYDSAERPQMNLNAVPSYALSERTVNIKERLSIKEPTDNSVYKIDSTLPIEYQNIFISSYIPKNVVSANLYCNKEIIANIDDLKKQNARLEAEKNNLSLLIKDYKNAQMEADKTIKTLRDAVKDNKENLDWYNDRVPYDVLDIMSKRYNGNKTN